MFLLFSQNTKTYLTPTISISSRFIFFTARYLRLGLFTLVSSLMRIIAAARVFPSPGTFFSYRCVTTGVALAGNIDSHKSASVVLCSSKQLVRVFFTPHRFLTVLFFFTRLFFTPTTNSNLRLSPYAFCFFFRNLILFRLWL
uniref:hypothetical protein n=1 Tax=Euplotes cristatus TaxID=756077 RepID=UPI002E75A4C7|nr:hypothetical protein V3A03_mgp02 [Euplotes cristatus]UPM52051.1 hypothetical protein [Euplotes cristatus]